LIGTIQNDLVKSAELTGSWEKQLKDIEKELYRCSVYQQHETNGRCFSLWGAAKPRAPIFRMWEVFKTS
jgi:hypothetical protein